MSAVGIAKVEEIKKRIRLCDYLVVAQLFLQDNFRLERELAFEDIKPRLLGHWGTCHGINVAYANLKAKYANDPNFSFILGPGPGSEPAEASVPAGTAKRLHLRYRVRGAWFYRCAADPRSLRAADHPLRERGDAFAQVV